MFLNFLLVAKLIVKVIMHIYISGLKTINKTKCISIV